MAPRTKDQQKAYNEKRRSENAVRKAEADASVKAIKAERKVGKPKTANVGVAHVPKAKIDVPKAKAARAKEVERQRKIPVTGSGKGKPHLRELGPGKGVELLKPIETKRDAKARAKIEDMSVKPARDPGMDAAIKRRDAQHAAKLSAEANALAKTVVAAVPKHDVAAQVKALGADSLLPQAGEVPKHTMARSYLRSGAPGLGKLRGKTYQATTSFTQDQMNQVVAAANFRQVSLAEMIRSCVVEHLNAGRAQVG